jgi:small-conductance mechanosensitive channel
MMTRLLETGPGDFDEFKGSVITLPNSVFLLHPIRNKNLTDDFVLHQIRIPFKNSENLEAKRNLLLSIANKICSKYLDQAITVFNKSIHRNFMKINISPDVSCEFLEPERIDLVLKLPVPKKERFSIQQKIIKEFLENLTQ